MIFSSLELTHPHAPPSVGKSVGVWFLVLSPSCWMFGCGTFQGMSQLELEDEVQSDLKDAMGESAKDRDSGKKLDKVFFSCLEG